MKKITLYFMAICLSLTFIPSPSKAEARISSVPAPTPTEQAEAKALLLRLDEISAMDKTNLNAADKKNLRVEVRSIRHKLKHIGGGVYISFGAIIIIVILLLILF
jgi:hypothetical protein